VNKKYIPILGYGSIGKVQCQPKSGVRTGSTLATNTNPFKREIRSSKTAFTLRSFLSFSQLNTDIVNPMIEKLLAGEDPEKLMNDADKEIKNLLSSK